MPSIRSGRIVVEEVSCLLCIGVIWVLAPLELVNVFSPRFERLRGGLRPLEVFLVELLVVGSIHELLLNYLLIVGSPHMLSFLVLESLLI